MNNVQMHTGTINFRLKHGIHVYLYKNRQDNSSCDHEKNANEREKDSYIV